jgi:hypothetical protein
MACYVDSFTLLHHPVTANIVPSSLNLFTLMMEEIHFSETSVLKTATWCHIPEYGIFLLISLCGNTGGS